MMGYGLVSQWKGESQKKIKKKGECGLSQWKILF